MGKLQGKLRRNEPLARVVIGAVRFFALGVLSKEWPEDRANISTQSERPAKQRCRFQSRYCDSRYKRMSRRPVNHRPGNSPAGVVKRISGHRYCLRQDKSPGDLVNSSFAISVVWLDKGIA